MAASCAAVAAGAGCFVGWLYGRDQATSAAEWRTYMVEGVVVGAVVGLVVGLLSAVLLVGLHRRAPIGAPGRVALTAVAAAVGVGLVVVVLSGFAVVWSAILFCSLAAGVPVAAAGGWVSYRRHRAQRTR